MVKLFLVKWLVRLVGLVVAIFSFTVAFWLGVAASLLVTFIALYFHAKQSKRLELEILDVLVVAYGWLSTTQIEQAILAARCAKARINPDSLTKLQRFIYHSGLSRTFALADAMSMSKSVAFLQRVRSIDEEYRPWSEKKKVIESMIDPQKLKYVSMNDFRTVLDQTSV